LEGVMQYRDENVELPRAPNGGFVIRVPIRFVLG
jgi:hypothetical protein